MPELAYRHPKRGKAHRLRPGGGLVWYRTECGQTLHGGDPAAGGLLATGVPVEQVDPADLCKRCWPAGGER